MGRFLFPLILIGLGLYGLTAHGAITDALTEMYPEEPARRTALQHCFEENRYFNRSSVTARTECYEKYLAASEVRT
jgi:hypothetical protein